MTPPEVPTIGGRAPAPPAPPRRRRWRRAAAVAALVLAALAAAGIVWGPRWVAARVRAALEDRTGHPATVGRVSLRPGRVVLENVRIEPLVALDRVEVRTRFAGIAPPHLRIEHVNVQGGRIDGSVEALADLGRRVHRGAAARAARGRGSAAGVGFDVSDVTLRVRDGDRTLTATLSARRRDRAAAQVRLEGGRLALEEASLSASFEAARAEVDPKAPFPLAIHLEGGGAQLRHDLAVAGVQGTVTLASADLAGVTARLRGGIASKAEAAGPVPEIFSLEAEVAPPAGTFSVTVHVDDVALAPVADAFAGYPWLDVGAGRFDGVLSVSRNEAGVVVEAAGGLRGITVHHPLLARAPIEDLDGRVELAATWHPRTRTLDLARLRLERRGAAVEIAGTLVDPRDDVRRRVSLVATVPEVPCQTVLDAVGPDLAPALQGFRLGGSFEAKISFDADWADLDALRLGGRVGIDRCRALEAPARAHPSRLRSPFTHRVALRDGSVRLVRLFPGSGSFTSLDGIAPAMVAAMLTTEDGGFFRHRGFLPSQFEEALRRNLKAGRVRLGASTITMQLAKNLFLSHERTVSRKLQEMFLTWYLERTLDKRRILELYLNIVEFGPGIYGVTEAARHYFGKHPRDLTPLEAFYLAAMLPSPVRRHVHHCKGRLSDRFDRKLRRLLAIAHNRGRIDTATYDTWKDAQLVFVPAPEDGDEASCLARIDHLLHAERAQAALSGLVAGGAPRGPVLPPPISAVGAAGAGDEANPDLAGSPAMDEVGGGE